MNGDSLIAALPKMSQDTNRAKVLVQLGKTYKLKNPQKGLYYSKEAVKLSRVLGYDPGIFASYDFVRVCYLSLGKIDSGIIWFKQQAKLDLKSANKKHIANNYRNLSVLYQINEDYDSAIANALHCVQILEKIPPSMSLAMAYSNLGNLYFDINKNYRMALEYYLKELPLEQNNKTKLANSYTAIACAYISLNKPKKTIEYGLKAIALCDSIESKGYDVFQALSCTGEAYMILKDNESALRLYKRAEKYIGSGNFPGCTGLFNNLTSVLILQKKYSEALIYAEKAVTSTEEAGPTNAYLLPDLKSAYLNYANSYAGLKKYDKEAEYLRLFIKMDDSIRVMDKSTEMQKMETKYETAKKEDQIKLLSADKALRNSEINRSRTLNYSLAGGGLLLALLVTALVFANRQKQKNNLALVGQRNLLQSQKDIIEARDKEKELLLRELNHRVKNNLQIVSSLLSLQSDQILDDKSKEAFKDGQSRVEAMSLIHQRLYLGDKFTKIDIQEYLQNLVKSVSNSYGYNPENFKLDFDVEKMDIDVEIAIPLGLIVNEILSNCFKHAFKSIDQPRLQMALQKTGENIDLRIADNGAGIPAEMNSGKAGSFGMKMVNSLTEQICGSLKIFNSEGSVFEFHIPLDKNMLQAI